MHSKFALCSTFEFFPRGKKRAAAQMTLRLPRYAAVTSAAAADRASGRLVGHPVLVFAAADQASGLGRLAGHLGLDCSCDFLD